MKHSRFSLLTVLLALGLLLSGCTTPARAERKLYYPTAFAGDGSASAVECETHAISENQTEVELAKALLSRLFDVPRTDGLRSLADFGLSMPKVLAYGSRLQLYFGESTQPLTDYTRSLVQYCICRTLLEGTSYSRILIYEEGTLRYDSSRDSTDYLLSVDALRAVDYAVTLYYPNQALDGFTEIASDFTLTADKSPEREILERLMAGSEDPNVENGFIDPDAQLLSVSASYGICTVNFSAEFLDTNTVSTDGTSLTVYAIVNSLCTLPDITRVQFLIDGKRQASYMHTEFDAPIAPQNADPVS